MRGAILQPGYLPWLGFFEQFAFAEVFVFLDDVQYTKQDWRNRNRIRSPSPEGWSWLTVPVQAAPASSPIHTVRIDYSRDWAGKHLNLLRNAYENAPHFASLFPLIRRRLQSRPEFLADLCIDLTRDLGEYLGIQRETLRSSDLHLAREDKSRHLLEICRRARIDWLYDGQKAADFLDLPLFEQHGIRVDFQVYAHPVYPQVLTPFVSHLSVVDLIFNCGPDSLSLVLQSPVVRDLFPESPPVSGKTYEVSG
jgi:hypothetical protein